MGKDIKISGKLLDLNTHRQVAKVGMSVTLASVCLSALYDNGIFKKMIVKAKTASKKA